MVAFLTYEINTLIAVITLIIYVIPLRRGLSNEIDLSGGLTIFLGVAGTLAAIKIALLSPYLKNCHLEKDVTIEPTYLILGCIATVWTSMSEVIKKFKIKLHLP